MGLKLEGTLALVGTLDLVADGGTVKASGQDVLVEASKPKPPHSSAGVPVILPPPPVGPTDPAPTVWIINAFNKTITVGGTPAVALGVHMQGSVPTWPGMALPSSVNTGVTANGVPLNVVNDKGITFPNGGSVTYTTSNQGA